MHTATAAARAARVGVAFLYHESNSFSPIPTGLSAFQAEDYHLGDAIARVYAGTRTELGGFFDGLESRQAEAVPLIAAAAMPSGPVTADAYDTLYDELARTLRAAVAEQPLDGLLLALHGSMVSPSDRDPEGTFVELARSILGVNTPIAVTLDLHANVSARLAEQEALIFGYQTYPHVDMYEQGRRAAAALLDACAGLPVQVCTVQLPMLLRSIHMRTDAGPMHDVVAYAREREGAGVYAVSPHSGFPYADTECSGAGVSVVAVSAQQAARTAREVANYFWQQRHRFQVDPVAPAAAIAEARQACAADETPVVLADVSDNPQSGGSADTTTLLRAVLDAQLGNTMMAAIYDPEVLAEARQHGPQAVLQVALAGKSAPEFGDPLQVSAEVLAVSDGVFTNDGPFNAGLTVDVGGAAWLRLRRVHGVALDANQVVDVVLTGRPVTANDPALYRHLGVQPRDYQVLVWKVKNHFRAAFAPLVGRIIPVDAPGPAQTDFTRLPFTYTDRSRWPFAQHRELGPLHVHGSRIVRHPGYVIRPATRHDLAAIAEFHVAVWQETYATLMDPEFLRALSVERRRAEWKHALSLAPRYRTLVAYAADGRFLGFASAHEHEPDKALRRGELGHPGSDPLALELHTLNLAAAARGTGLAEELIWQLLEDRAAYAWVVEGNTRAIQFYRKMGFELTGERRADAEAQADDLRMIRHALPKKGVEDDT